jgi:hypothetical protein
MPVKKQAGGTKVSERLTDGTYKVQDASIPVIKKLLNYCDLDILSWTSLGSFIFKGKFRPDTPIILRSQVYRDSDDTKIQTRLTREEQVDSPENVSLGQRMHSFVIKFAFISKTGHVLTDKYLGVTKATATEAEAKHEASIQQIVHKKMLCWDGVTPFSPDIISNEIMSAEDFKAMFSVPIIKHLDLPKQERNKDFMSVIGWICEQLDKNLRLKVSLTVMDLVEGRTLANEYIHVSKSEYSKLCLQALAKIIILAMKCSASPYDLHRNNIMVVTVKDTVPIKRRVNVIDYGRVYMLRNKADRHKVISIFYNFISSDYQEKVVQPDQPDQPDQPRVYVPISKSITDLQKIASFFNIDATSAVYDEIMYQIIDAFTSEVFFLASLSETENESMWSKLRNDNPESYSIMHRILMVIAIIDFVQYNQLQCNGILSHLYNHGAHSFNTNVLQDDLYFYEIHNIDYSKELLRDPTLSIRFKALHEQLIETISECVMPIPSGVSNIVAAPNPPPPPLPPLQTLDLPNLLEYVKKNPRPPQPVALPSMSPSSYVSLSAESPPPPQPVALPSMSPSSYVSLSAESPPPPLAPPNLLEDFKKKPVGPQSMVLGGYSTRRRRRRTRRRVVARRYSIKLTNSTNKRQNKRKYKNKK